MSIRSVIEMKRKLLMVVNVDWFLISHRLPIAIAALEEGYDVHLACRFTGQQDYLESLGFIIHELPFSRAGMSMINEVKTCFSILVLLRRLRPDVIHAITIKPSLYVGIIARALGMKELIIAVSGLGLVFVSKGCFALLRKWIVKLLYKLAVNPKHTRLIFQNKTDLATIQNIVNPNPKNVYLIKGSGVDLAEYKYTNEPLEEKLVVSLASRLLKAKGIYEFIRAAEILGKSEFADLISFRLIGVPDIENPDSILQEEIEVWRQSGIVDYLGFRKDMSKVFSETNIVVLPSYYGEGLPKVLIEAAACGRAIITTDCPGCRDAILDGITGVLVPAKDSLALSNAILRLAKNRALVTQMGRAGRKYAEKTFSVNSVVSDHLDIYMNLMGKEYK